MGTRPRPDCSGSSRRGRGMGGQNGPQADADVLRHPRHSATAKRQSADDTTANQTTTSHRWCCRAGPGAAAAGAAAVGGASGAENAAQMESAALACRILPQRLVVCDRLSAVNACLEGSKPADKKMDVMHAEAVQPTAAVAFKLSLWSGTRGSHELESAPRKDAPRSRMRGCMQSVLGVWGALAWGTAPRRARKGTSATRVLESAGTLRVPAPRSPELVSRDNDSLGYNASLRMCV